MLDETTLEGWLGRENIRCSRFRDNFRVTVADSRLLDFMTRLRDAGFDMLSDITAVDYLNYPDATDRFIVAYVLINTQSGQRLVVRAAVNDPDPALPSVYSIWRGADWMEREVYDMFGITFTDHPDLRRILMPDEFSSFPLRKDYPLRGRGERHNFPVITRSES